MITGRYVRFRPIAVIRSSALVAEGFRLQGTIRATPNSLSYSLSLRISRLTAWSLKRMKRVQPVASLPAISAKARAVSLYRYVALTSSTFGDETFFFVDETLTTNRALS